MTTREQPTRLELSTIRPIALEERHGAPRDLFTVWFGSNLMLLTIVTGGLAVTSFGLSFGWAVAGLAIGNLVGAVFMALHSAQGPRLGVPQMVQTRGQFGSIGSLLVIGIVIVMYVGFVASNLVLGGEALAGMVPGWSSTPGILIVGVLSALAAIYGYDLIHGYTRLMAYVCGAVLLLTFVWIVWVHGLPADFLTRNSLNVTGLMGTISVAALWQIAYAPYVSDYSRYLPPDTEVGAAFWATYWGCVLGSLLPMILGVMVALSLPKGDLVLGLATLTRGVAPLILVVFSVSVAANNAMNLYCGALSSLTFGQTLCSDWSPGSRSRVLTTVALFLCALMGALFGSAAFMHYYEAFLSLLLYVLVPWTSINLVDYYLLRHGEYDVSAFFRSDGGIYGRINAAAIGCYLLGFLVQLPFMVSTLYTGALARLSGNVDLSWVVGLALTSVAYYWLARSRLFRHAPA